MTTSSVAPASLDGLAGAVREQTRARYPDDEGYLERDGVRIWYGVYGTGSPDILLLPTARYRAGRRMDYDDSPPEVIAAAIAEEIGREVDHRPVAADGAARAAALLAEML